MALPLNQYQLNVLNQAVDCLEEKDLATYFQLRAWLKDRPQGWEKPFRRTFSQWYGLNTGGLTDAFKTRYFQILFDLEISPDEEPYTEILLDLFQLPNRKGSQILAGSFTSKLVAMHDETRPIYDRHVADFFGLSIPGAGGINFRIAGFVSILELLRGTYLSWQQEPAFQEIIDRLKRMHPSAAECVTPRLADFLVWTVGNRQLVVGD